MAIVFSQVSLTSGDNAARFLVAGEPACAADLSGWTAYHEFIRSNHKAQAYVSTYTYGDGEHLTATPEQVAYITIRMTRRPDMLESRCNKISTNQFTIGG